mmetsp:Transcript_51835/g.149488  ORF Transcript_51835/g.149488 Transcript_51835/m.149488 type:complete len:200 (+) Transcript_51835:3-602(+)
MPRSCRSASRRRRRKRSDFSSSSTRQGSTRAQTPSFRSSPAPWSGCGSSSSAPSASLRSAWSAPPWPWPGRRRCPSLRPYPRRRRITTPRRWPPPPPCLGTRHSATALAPAAAQTSLASPLAEGPPERAAPLRPPPGRPRTTATRAAPQRRTTARFGSHRSARARTPRPWTRTATRGTCSGSSAHCWASWRTAGRRSKS